MPPDCLSFWRLTECPTVWMKLPRSRRPKQWDNIDDPMVPLRTQPMWPSIGKTAVGKKSGRNHIARRLGASTQRGMSLCSPTRSSLPTSFRQRRKKWLEEKTQLRPCEVQLKKKIELEEPTPLIARVVTQWNRARNKGLARLLKDLQ